MRKAQAAMEFLMTYGWAILVVLVVIGALAYFGVLSPSTLLPEKCTLPIQLSCRDHRVTDTSIRFVIQNGAGKDMNLSGIAFQGEAITGGSCSNRTMIAGLNSQIANGGSAEFIVSPCTFSNTGRDKNRYTINITYNWLDSSYSHIIQGELFSRKES